MGLSLAQPQPLLVRVSADANVFEKAKQTGSSNLVAVEVSNVVKTPVQRDQMQQLIPVAGVLRDGHASNRHGPTSTQE